MIVRSGQLVQQDCCLLQVSGIKAFGELAVDRRQELTGLVPLALLPAGDVEGLVKTGFGLGPLGDGPLPQELPFKPI